MSEKCRERECRDLRCKRPCHRNGSEAREALFSFKTDWKLLVRVQKGEVKRERMLFSECRVSVWDNVKAPEMDILV